MPKTSSLYICEQCGYQSPSFLGKCPECGAWNSLVEQIIDKQSQNNTNLHQKIPEIVHTSDIEKSHIDRLKTGIDEFDRVLGGGVVKGSVVLISGDPGVGKSTLLTQLTLNLNKLSAGDTKSQEDGGVPKVLYVAGEESAHQIKIRVDRLQKNADVEVLNEVDVDLINKVIEDTRPLFVIVDSIQTLQTKDLVSTPGSLGQVRETAYRLQKTAKMYHIPIIIVGHVTKDGAVAGPRTLEHLVDVVLSLEGDLSSQYRILRSDKNRFGPTDEVGIFDMTEEGMVEVKNPSKLFLQQKVNSPGSAIAIVMTGLRPLLIEVQALVSKSFLPLPRRVGSGVDNNRLQLLVAVLAKRLNLPIFDQDIYVNLTGGIKILEPALDLAVCSAIVSSLKNKPIKPSTAFVGEVGLLGELRIVRGLNRRSVEARKLGITNVISYENANSLQDVMRLAL